jgi:hypothetical protein
MDDPRRIVLGPRWPGKHRERGRDESQHPKPHLDTDSDIHGRSSLFDPMAATRRPKRRRAVLSLCLYHGTGSKIRPGSSVGAFAFRIFRIIRLIKLVVGIDRKCDGRHIAGR